MKKSPIVLTLDAGGTNFEFSAIRDYKMIVEKISFPSNAHNLDLCISTMFEGFKKVISLVPQKPSAISFAFPGPADYPNGIIGDLGNLPAFRGGVPLGAMLEEELKLPVFINNDGDLYAYGEALAGILPEINQKLKEEGNPKQYKNLVGFTLGTGFGCGIVSDGKMHIGDNSVGAEVWLLSSKYYPDWNIEEGVSIRAVKRTYTELANLSTDFGLEPKDIYEIAIGNKPGKKQEAIEAFQKMGTVLGDAISNVATLIDSIIVIGGGISGAADLFWPSMLETMRGNFNINGKHLHRLVCQVFDLRNPEELVTFTKGSIKTIPVPGTNRSITYDPMQRIGIALSKIGASQAIMMGAYAFAIDKMKTTIKKTS